MCNKIQPYLAVHLWFYPIRGVAVFRKLTDERKQWLLWLPAVGLPAALHPDIPSHSLAEAIRASHFR